jgi:hypothetical protein
LTGGGGVGINDVKKERKNENITLKAPGRGGSGGVAVVSGVVGSSVLFGSSSVLLASSLRAFSAFWNRLHTL